MRVTNQKFYGFPYQGSKSAIIPWLFELLPSGSRFVDLFGGGGAVTHGAILSKNYSSFLYNDAYPLVYEYIREEIEDGRLDPASFSFDWVSRERFYAERNSDPYIRYVWSFSFAGDDYAYGYTNEPRERELHMLAWYGEPSSWLEENTGARVVAGDTYTERLKVIRALLRSRNIDDRVGTRISAIERIQDATKIIRSAPLTLCNSDYRDVPLRAGDVVYCDPPYEGTAQYAGQEPFDSLAFYEWVKKCDLPVFFSSYDISDNSFFVIGRRMKVNCMNGGKGQMKKRETLYGNDRAAALVMDGRAGNLLSGMI